MANVVSSTLRKYREMEQNNELSKDQKTLAIQKELEEATALELPMMQQNLPIIATITTLGTLMGLLGTVIGMIRSFAALSAGGGTDSVALSTGISEALINTAFGILTGALAVISYNYYTNKIDKLTYSLDEVGFPLYRLLQPLINFCPAEDFLTQTETEVPLKDFTMSRAKIKRKYVHRHDSHERCHGAAAYFFMLTASFVKKSLYRLSLLHQFPR